MGTVGYGVGMDSFVHSSEAAIANSTGLQAELPDDQDNLAVVGIDMWNDAESVSSSCTTGGCVFDPIAFVQNDGVVNLVTSFRQRFMSASDFFLSMQGVFYLRTHQIP